MSDFIVAVLSHKSSQYWLYTTVHMVCCTGIYHFLRFLVHSLLFTAVLKTAGCGRKKKKEPKTRPDLFSPQTVSLFLTTETTPRHFIPFYFPLLPFISCGFCPFAPPPSRGNKRKGQQRNATIFFPLVGPANKEKRGQN